ncbi:hypothetical protein BGW41_007362 [Actinomortierella wolfii]|nr:hypothetical protein BGW41_007362 [Actinomortierella wolfii]
MVIDIVDHTSGFCGRTQYHCSGAKGCNPDKGSCGVVFLDKADTPRVIPYEQIDPNKIKDLANRLKEEGIKLDPEQLKKNSTLESILMSGADDKIKFPGSLNKAKEAEAANNSKDMDKNTNSSNSNLSGTKPTDSSSASKMEPSKSPIAPVNGVTALVSFANPLVTLGLMSLVLWVML